jgi:hypothetical protein
MEVSEMSHCAPHKSQSPKTVLWTSYKAIDPPSPLALDIESPAT